MDSLSISNSVSKGTRFEDTEMSTAYFEDLKNREDDAISNEKIRKGDQILHTYEVTSDAISGGMGSVWRVHHNGWDTDLAMKRPQPRFFAEGGEAKKKQFVEECENWIKLGLHPNIVSCYYVREIGGVPTIFSEWMDGGSLSDRIRDCSLYEGSEENAQERILNIAIQAASGLKYSHENTLIHQDMKPGNLLLTKDWEAKVADFGLARAKSNLEGSLEAAKSSGYTLAYCPAEQANQEAPARWMDIYAWALTVLEMYAGKRLWTTGADAKEHFENYSAQCAHRIPDKMKILLQSCLNEKPDTFDSIKGRLIDIYREETGADYADAEYSELTDSAENLNNRALSFLDLKQTDNAEKYWKMALAQNPDHTESVINSILFRWYCDRFGAGSVSTDKVSINDLKQNNHNDLYSVTVLLYASILTCNREDAMLYLDALEGLGADQGECARFKALIDEKCREPELLRRFGENEIPLVSSKRGDVVVLDGAKEYARIISVSSNDYKGDFHYTNNGAVSFAVFNEAGDYLALCGSGGITVWDVKKRKKLFQNTRHNMIYALFDEEKQQVAAVRYDETRVFKDGVIFQLPGGREAGRFETRSITGISEYKVHFFAEEDGKLFVTVPNSESIIDCYLDAQGRTQYSFHPCRFRDYNNSHVCFRSKEAEIPIRTTFKKEELPLSADLICVMKEDGYEIYRIPTPDLSMLPHMELSKIHSIQEQAREKEEYQILISEAEQLLAKKDYFEALSRIDAILALKNYEHDSRALALRNEINAHMKNKTFLKCIELRDFDETLPPASPGTYPEAPQEIFTSAENCLSIENAQSDYSGNVMFSALANAMQMNEYPIQKVYCTSDEHTFICCGWHHEHRQVAHTPDFDPIIQDSTAYQLSIYNTTEHTRKVFPPFSSTYMRGMYLEKSYQYQMFVAYSEEYHRLVAGNEDYDTPRVTWDTETQTQVAEVDEITSFIQLLSNPRYYLAVGARTIYIMDLKDNAIVWTEGVPSGRQIKYRGNIRFDRERDIYQLEMTDGSYLSGQVLWSYDAEENVGEAAQAAPGKAEEAPGQNRAQDKKPAVKAKSTVDATLYVDDTKNFIIEDGVLKKYTGKKAQVIIPDTVSKIGVGLFRKNETLESVVIPEGVTQIGSFAFEQCKNLTDITIPESVDSVGDSVFAGCESLKTIVLPDYVSHLGDSMFADCTSLSSVKLPEGITSIGERMFFNCSRMRGIYIPEDVERIGREAFKNCSGIGRIIIPDNVTVIGEGAFEGCTFMDAIEEMSYMLEVIGDSAFRSCRRLDWIRLSSGVEYIGANAFRDCRALKEMGIPGTVRSIGEEAFFGCRNLEKITIPESVTSIGENAFGSVKDGFVLYGKTGSEAERYARSENIPFSDPSAEDSESEKETPVEEIPSVNERLFENNTPENKDAGALSSKKGFFARLFGGRK